jgi:hypothetical protein
VTLTVKPGMGEKLIYAIVGRRAAAAGNIKFCVFEIIFIFLESKEQSEIIFVGSMHSKRMSTWSSVVF